MGKQDNVDVLFYTTKNCGPCKMMKHKLDAVKIQLPFRLKTVNIDSMDKKTKNTVKVAPVIKIVKNGEKIVGNVGVDDLRNILMRNLYSYT